MKTKTEFITELQSEYPVIQVGSDQVGYTHLQPEEYDAQIAEWADTLLAKQEAEALAAVEKAETEAKRQALLAKLGITEDEAQLLLGGN